MSLYLHTTSTKWLDSLTIQGHLMNLWTNSWMAKVRSFTLHCLLMNGNLYVHIYIYLIIWLRSTFISFLFAVLFGKWTDHVKSWKHSELGDRIMYITYEEMVQVVKQGFFLSIYIAIVSLKSVNRGL